MLKDVIGKTSGKEQVDLNRPVWFQEWKVLLN